MTDDPVDREQTYVRGRGAEIEKKEADARSYFGRTGAYRAEDVMDLLGDPRDRVEIKTPDVSRVASWTDE